MHTRDNCDDAKTTVLTSDAATQSNIFEHNYLSQKKLYNKHYFQNYFTQLLIEKNLLITKSSYKFTWKIITTTNTRLSMNNYVYDQ